MQLSLSDRWDYMECDSPPLSIDGHLSVPCLYFQRIYIGSSHHNSSTLHQSPTLLWPKKEEQEPIPRTITYPYAIIEDTTTMAIHIHAWS